MSQIRRILHASDFSPASRAAFATIMLQGTPFQPARAASLLGVPSIQ